MRYTTLRPPPSSFVQTPPPTSAPSYTHRRPFSVVPPSCRSLTMVLLEMTNVTRHRYKGKLSSTTRHGNRVAPAMLSRCEKKRAEGLFLRRERAKIYVLSRLLTRARGFPHGGAARRGSRLTTTNDADLCFLLIVF